MPLPAIILYSTRVTSSLCILEIRSSFGQALATFVSSILQISPDSAERLNAFQTQTLASLEPVDKKQRDANTTEIDQIIDSIGIDSIPVADTPVMNSRAGLYIYLNALVSSAYLKGSQIG